jgi:two-component system, NtrC family, sensor histidine kinase KinB
MSRDEDDQRSADAACLSEYRELLGKVRLLEKEWEAALLRMRELEAACEVGSRADRPWTELACRALVELLEGITEGTQDLIAAKDTHCRFLFFNKAYRDEVKKIHGIDIELGSNIIEALSHLPEDHDKALRLWSRALNGETFTVVEELGEPGRRQIYEFRFNPLRKAEGHIVGAAHIVRNITDRVRAEEALRLNRERFQSLVETVDDWVWEVDAKGVYTYASPRIRHLLGYEPEEILGKMPFDLMSAAEREKVGAIFREIVQKRLPFRALENTNLHKDGHPVVLETSGNPLFDDSGQLLGYRGVDRDITERKRMEQERQELIEADRRRLGVIEAIFDATQDGIVIYDADGKILRLNAAAEDFLGLTPEQRSMDVARRWELLQATKMDGSPLPAEEIPSLRALAGEKVQAVLRFDPPLRPTRCFSVSAAPIGSAKTSLASAVTMLTDITEFHELQQEKEIFMQMISHDLRTPITVIQGHLELLQKEISEPNEMTALHLEAILAGTHQLNGMLEDLTQMLHLQKGRIPLELKPVHLPDFLAQLVSRLAVNGNGRLVEKAFPPDLPLVWADACSLERVLANLMTNAFKYSSPGSPVRVAAEVVGEEVRVSVTDHGKGIALEDQPYLFERFFRARDAGQKRGIGLGLYITRILVEAHGGRVWVESAPGQGSVFTFSLPLQRTWNTS